VVTLTGHIVIETNVELRSKGWPFCLRPQRHAFAVGRWSQQTKTDFWALKQPSPSACWLAMRGVVKQRVAPTIRIRLKTGLLGCLTVWASTKREGVRILGAPRRASGSAVRS